MSYLGRGLEQVDNISKLDNITFNGGTTYALTKDSAAFTPISSNAILVSVSGVIQQGNFSISGTNIVFNSAVASTESCDFIMHYGTGVITTPSDGSVTNAKISDMAASKLTGTVAQANIADQAINEAKMQISNAPTNGYFLSAQSGNTGGLTWAEAGGGGLVFVGSTSSSSEVSNLTIDNVFTSTYTNYLIVGEYTLINGSGPEARFIFRTGGSSGNDLTGSEYNYHFIRMNADSNSLNNIKATADSSCTFTAPTNNDSARVGARISWTVFDPFPTGKRTSVSGTGKMTATDAHSAFISGSCDYKGSESVTGIKFYAHADNVKNGEFRVYGIVDS